MQKVCPACNNVIEFEDSLFCSECGFNLQISTIDEPPVKKIKKIKSNSLIKQEFIDQYLYYNEELKRLANIDNQYTQQEHFYNNISRELNKAQTRYNVLRSRVQKELRDVEELKKVSWRSIKASFKGNKEQLIQKEEQEYFEAVNKLQAAEEDLKQLQNKFNTVKQQFDKIKEVYNYKKSIERNIIELIHKATEGVPDPIEDKIEQELINLNNQMVPITTEKQKLIIARDNLYTAKRYVDNCINILRSAMRTADWDTFYGGGMMASNLKYSKMARARNELQMAYRNIQNAYYLYPNMPRVPQIQIDNGTSFFWDTAFDNFFTDMQSRSRINNSYRQVQYLAQSLMTPINWIIAYIANVDQQLYELQNIINKKQQELFIERKRMIEEAISQ